MALIDVLQGSALTLEPSEIEDRLAEGWTLPAEFYTDPRVYELEQERVFRCSWQFAGLERDVAQVGDFLTTSVGGVPVVVVRDRERQLRAHVNVCRHRGHAVAVGQGNRRSLQCRYHGWTYDLSGCLRAASISTSSSRSASSRADGFRDLRA